MTNSKALNHFNRGMQKSVQNDFYGAIEDFSNAISAAQNYTEAYIKRAQAKCSTMEISQILDAYSDYDKAVSLEPFNTEALNGRGALMIQLSPESPDGLNDLEKAAKIDPLTCSYWNIGTAKMQMKDYDGMLRAFQDFIEIERPKDSRLGEGYYFIGVALQNLKQWDKAIENFSKAITNKASLNYYWAFFNRAVSYSQINKVDEAIIDYGKVIELKPDMSDTYINRSKLLLAKDLDEQAIQDLIKALSLDKDNIEITEELAMQLVFNKKYGEALTYYTRLIKLHPDAAQHYQNRGACYLGLQKYKQGISDFNKAIKMNSSGGHAFYYRGVCHFYLENDQACDDWKIACDKGCKEAKPWMDKHCKYEEKHGIEIGDGLWISLDDIITNKPGG